jgi:DNA topoisomerase IB
MKKFIYVFLVVAFVTSCSVVGLASRKDNQKTKLNFKVENQNVYLDGKVIAVYQAKTYSLDGGELVEEYNLKYTGSLANKQLIGDLIDFVSDRHQGAEVEVEIDPENGQFKL